MNFQFDAVMFLALFTLGAGLVIGIISLTRAKQAEAHHEDAAVAQRQRHEETAAPVEGTPGGIDPTVSDQHGTDQREPDRRSSTAAATDRDHGDVPVAPTDSGRSWSKERGANPPTPAPPRN